MRAIYILWLRQLKRFIRKKASLVGALGQPVIFLLAFGFGLSPIFARAGAGNYMQFLAPGIIAMTVLFTSIFTGVEIIWDRQFGFLKKTFVAPISRFEILLGKTFGGATVAIVQGLLVFLITLLVGFRPVSLAMLPVAFLFLVMVACLFSALGTVIAARLDDMQGFPLIINFVIQPLFYLSGALFPLAGLPKVLEIITQLNPLSYGVDGLRGTLTGIVQFSLWTDMGVLVGVTLLLLWIGSLLFSRIQI
jgi:ABC-2 type transport system permease protein